MVNNQPIDKRPADFNFRFQFRKFKLGILKLTDTLAERFSLFNIINNRIFPSNSPPFVISLP
jgi:hypothetical protein